MTNKLNFLPIGLLLYLFTFICCVHDDDFAIPDLSDAVVEIDGEVIDIDALYGLWQQELNSNGNQLFTFEDSSNLYTSGYVISSDEGGNFFEELILQNAPGLPTSGVKLLLDVNPLFTTYEFGRKVFVRLDGLSLGLNSGVLSLGVRDGNAIGKLAESQLEQVIIRDPEVATIVPLEIGISEFTMERTNLYVQLSDVQFKRSEVIGANHKTFAAEPGDQFDGERILEGCSESGIAVLSTSTFADFKAVLLPQGRGRLHAVLTMDFFGESFNLVANDPRAFQFDSAERCDPETYSCDAPSGGGEPIFAENFEQFASIDEYVNMGWTNTNLEQGSTLFEIGNFDNNNYAQISGFNSGESMIETWLIGPAVNMDSTTGEELLFDVQPNFDNGTLLSVWVSTNFTGEIGAASWELLDADIPIGPADGFGSFQTVGPINVACIEGVAHFAFRYSGSDPDATTRYHIDNIRITGN